MFPRIRRLLAATLLCVCLPVAAAAPDAVATAPLATMVGRLDLPFEHVVTHRDFSTGMSSGLWAREDITLVTGPGAGAWAGQELRVRSQYISPEKTDAGVVQGAVRTEVEKAAADPATTLVKPVPVAGFDFTLIELVRTELRVPRRVTRLVGSINGALVALEVQKPDDASLDALLQARMPAMALDFAALLRLRGQFERERDRVVQDGGMATPVGRLSPPRGAVPRLTTLGVVRDGEGKVQQVSHFYGLHRTGWWTEQRMGLLVTCDRRADDPKVRGESLEPFGDVATLKLAPGFSEVVVGGFPAKRFRGARAASANLGETKLERWVAIAGGDIFVAQVEHINGQPLVRDIEGQLQGMKFTCDTAGAGGAFAVEGTVAAAGKGTGEVRE